MILHGARISIEQPAIGYLIREGQILKLTQGKLMAELRGTFSIINHWENGWVSLLALKQTNSLLRQLDNLLDAFLQESSKALQAKHSLQRERRG